MRKVQDRTTYLNDNTLKDIIAAHLYAVSALADDEEVLTISMSEPDEEGIRVLDYQLIKNKDVELVIHS